MLDIIFGSIATLIGAIGTYALRKNKWLAPLPPIIANTLIVPFVLRYAYGSEGIFAMFFVTIGASEFIVKPFKKEQLSDMVTNLLG